MKLRIIIFLCTFFTVSCTSQLPLIDHKGIPYEKLNVKEFDKRFDDNPDWQKDAFLLEDGTYVQENEYRGNYYQYIISSNAYYGIAKEFYKDGQLKSIGRVFGNNVKIGIWRFYDEKGILKQEINEDLKFGSFSYNDILKYLHAHNKLKMVNKDIPAIYYLDAHFDDKKWNISVFVPVDQSKMCKDCPIGSIDEYNFDTETGKLIYKKEGIKIVQDFNDLQN
ncbi:MAG: hypothetical protein LBE92_05475 [Chryseobacterium sp.]|jgi:hypothetical protein|uniref:hypothetical protein n=1 Tax=Chryseobacterium sp. TaxID=1871047 RepID=UPI002839AA1B|nr:hypothetical protein [Chryseobacterium sp.]MDR2235552.1 hypothetical protein [Chryseobacterium sp.]